jgi:D-3-phosphoglycerate dehydrogenase
MPRVFVVDKVHPAGLALLRQRPGITVETLELPTPDTILEGARAADGIVIRTSPLPGAAIAAAPHLKIVSRHGVGYDNVDLAALNARRIPLAVVGSVNAVSVAEHALYLLLATMKCGAAYDHAVRAGPWGFRNSLAAREVDGKTLLILGFGRIGREVARRAAAFGMRILVHDPFLAANAITAPVEPAADLDAALAEADAVSLHLPLTAESRHIIDAARLARMKPTAVLISTARGGLIDEAALVDALRERRLAAAGLDVFAEEPPPADHPLLGLDNVVLSPHSASLTQESAMRMSVVAAQNCLDGLDGTLDPSLVVNPDVLGARP